MWANPYRVGDRVMVVRNDSEREVFNGDPGRVEAITNGEVLVRIGSRVLAYSRDRLGDLVPSYCVDGPSRTGVGSPRGGHGLGQFALPPVASEPALHRYHAWSGTRRPRGRNRRHYGGQSQPPEIAVVTVDCTFVLGLSRKTERPRDNLPIWRSGLYLAGLSAGLEFRPSPIQSGPSGTSLCELNHNEPVAPGI